MKLLIRCICFMALFAGCRHQNKNKDIDLYFEKEIIDRVNVICKQPDSMQISPAKINREVNNLVLMSKDIENIVAVTGRANRYFKTLADEQHLNAATFTPLSPDMELDNIASALKENELNFFNQVIFKMKGAEGIKIHTAQ